MNDKTVKVREIYLKNVAYQCDRKDITPTQRLALIKEMLELLLK